jgi:hypothetical protein
MNRAEFVQREIVGNAPLAADADTRASLYATRIRLANELADALEKSGTASWDIHETKDKSGSHILRESIVAEREACAKVAGRYAARLASGDAQDAAVEIAAQIRARHYVMEQCVLTDNAATRARDNK